VFGRAFRPKNYRRYDRIASGTTGTVYRYFASEYNGQRSSNLRRSRWRPSARRVVAGDKDEHGRRSDMAGNADGPFIITSAARIIS